MTVPAVAACASPGPPPGLPANPLPPCPDAYNCVRDSRAYTLPPDVLLDRARVALTTIGADTVRVDAAGLRIDAVFPVFFLKDDLALVVGPYGDGAVLHVRSASRVGYSDLGVNRRRVRRFFDTPGA